MKIIFLKADKDLSDAQRTAMRDQFSETLPDYRVVILEGLSVELVLDDEDEDESDVDR